MRALAFALSTALTAAGLFTLGVAGQPAVAQPTGLPNLVIDAARLKSSLFFESKNFGAGSCVYQPADLCVNDKGKRKLMKFDVAIENIGDADLVLGNPATTSSLFVYSPCHRHYHLKDFAKYELLNSAGAVVLTGRKQAFCLEDFERYESYAPTSATYVCGFQGISRGWADVYGSYLDCQWLDVTGFPAGNYSLRVSINPDTIVDPNTNTRLIQESNYLDNSATVPVTIPLGR